MGLSTIVVVSVSMQRLALEGFKVLTPRSKPEWSMGNYLELSFFWSCVDTYLFVYKSVNGNSTDGRQLVVYPANSQT